MKKKEKIQFMTYREMINYAADKYPVLKKALARNRDERYFNQIKQKISRTLEEYKIKYIWSEETENTNENENDVSKNTEEIKNDVPKKRHKKDDDNIIVPKPFGECVIDKILAPYLIERYGYPKRMYNQELIVPSEEDLKKMYEKFLKNPEKYRVNQINDEDYLSFTEPIPSYFPKFKYETVSKLMSAVLTDYINFNVGEFRKNLKEQRNHIFDGAIDKIIDEITDEIIEKSSKIMDEIIEKSSEIVYRVTEPPQSEAMGHKTPKFSLVYYAKRELPENKALNPSYSSFPEDAYNGFYQEFKKLNIIPTEIKEMVCMEIYSNIKKLHSSNETESENLKKYLNTIFQDFMVNERINDLFCNFFDFDKEKFLKDLEKQADFILDNSSTIDDGYSEVTWRLRNPVGIYVFPKRAGVNTHNE